MAAVRTSRVGYIFAPFRFHLRYATYVDVAEASSGGPPYIGNPPPQVRLGMLPQRLDPFRGFVA